jgi:hypothetical protein
MHQNHLRPLARATGLMLAAALAPAALLAQTPAATPSSEREQALEARIATLERMVSELIAQQAAAPPPAVAQAPSTPAAAPAPGAAPPAPPIQSTAINTAGWPGTRFSFGGFIKLEAVATGTDGGEIADGSNGRLLYAPSLTPVGNADEGADLDATAQFSRFWFSADSAMPDGTPLKGYLEFDLFGSALGAEATTNTYGVTVRHAYASWGKWLAGQTWSNFQDPASLVDTIDLIGATDGTIFVRQAQLRYTTGPWAFSLENPETTVGSFRGNGARISSDDNRLPDLTARWTRKGDWGHLSVAGLLRELRHETTTGIDDAQAGYGVSITGRRVIGGGDDLRFGLTAGRGISRYVGLGIAPDVLLDARNDLDAIAMVAGFAGVRHVFNPTLRGNLYGSLASFDNDTAASGTGATEKVGSIAANVIYSPYPKLDIGIEGRLGRRWLENGAEGDLARLHFHVKYAF